MSENGLPDESPPPTPPETKSEYRILQDLGAAYIHTLDIHKLRVILGEMIAVPEKLEIQQLHVNQAEIHRLRKDFDEFIHRDELWKTNINDKYVMLTKWGGLILGALLGLNTAIEGIKFLGGF